MLDNGRKKGRKPKEKHYNSTFASNLRRILNEEEKKGITLSAIAEELGVNRQSLAQYRDGNNVPDVEILKRISERFNVSADYLIGISTVNSFDTDFKTSCKYTGLSELAVSRLHELCKKGDVGDLTDYPYSDIISLMIFDDKFLETVSRYLCFDKDKIIIKVAHDGMIDISEYPIEISIDGKPVVIRKGSNYVVGFLEESLCEDVYLRIRRLKEIYLNNKRGE